MDERDLRDALEAEAERLGFHRFAVAAAAPSRHAPHLERWLAEGRHGEMTWMAREPERRADPRRVLPGARSVVTLLTHYPTEPEGPSRAWVGRVSRYAWGADYHNVLGRRLRKLARFLRTAVPGAGVVPAVDSKPVLEKEAAERAGLGWIGKHTNLITTDRGSWFFLSELVTDIALPVDATAHPDRCGKCRACLDACPTGAIVAPYVVDARLCISYLTIELKGPIPRELRPDVGEWIFGCDVCQDVCPWNRFAVPVTDPRFRLDEARFDGDLGGFLRLDEADFRERFRGSPVKRAGRDGFVRNVCVALGNRGRVEDVSTLARALAHDPSPLVRGHAAWALGRIGGNEAGRALEDAAGRDSHGEVLAEIREARREGSPRAAPPEGSSRNTPSSSRS